MSPSLSGRRVLVIGGSRHLGAAIAAAASAHGARVIIGARDLRNGARVAASLPGASSVHVDLANESTLEVAAREMAPGGLDHIVITASAHHNASVAELTREGIGAALSAKVVGPLLVAKHFAPLMNNRGSLLLFSGVAAWNPAPGYTVMGVTNGAVEYLASHLAVALAPLRVNAISPGIVDSGTWDALGEDAKDELLKGAAAGTLVGRSGVTEDIVATALWLLGAGFVTGETIHVEGGARLA